MYSRAPSQLGVLPSMFMQPSLAQIALVSILTVLPTLLWLRKGNKTSPSDSHDASATDPGLLKKFTKFNSYHVPKTGFTYPSVRIFYRAHPQTDKLPRTPSPLPLLVFIHGLGGSAAQFGPLLTSVVNAGPCLAVDLPGCGLSEFAPTDWDAYTTDALAQLLQVIIESYRDVENEQGVIFLGHSLGSSLCALLASRTSKLAGEISRRTVGLIAMCPRVTPFSDTQQSQARSALHIPTPILDLWRAWDRRGGQDSASVRRFVGAEAETEAKRLQVRFNAQSKSSVWRRMAYGALPKLGEASTRGAMLSDATWAGLDVPVLVIAGEDDRITPPSEAKALAAILEESWSKKPKNDEEHWTELPVAPTPKQDGKSEPQTLPPEAILKPPRALKTIILPSPASHGLVYAPTTCRTISGLIHNFISDHIDKRLSLGWQLQYLSTEGKWDVKNLEKWRAVRPVSEPIGGLFRAMKTMREVDDSHCPKEFVKKWAGQIYAVIDISHDSPVYDPNGLEEGGIQYHKFPTVSKLPPCAEEVHNFIELVDRLRQEMKPKSLGGDPPLLAVHCHYGFNRTGFLIVCYLVERRGWRLQDALEEFEKARPPGIRHEYFLDALHVRYFPGLKKAPTL